MSVRGGMHKLAPMLDRLGYDPSAFPPNYGDPDRFVMENTRDVKQNAQLWKQRSDDVYSVSKPSGKRRSQTTTITRNSSRVMSHSREAPDKPIYKYSDDSDVKSEFDDIHPV